MKITAKQLKKVADHLNECDWNVNVYSRECPNDDCFNNVTSPDKSLMKITKFCKYCGSKLTKLKSDSSGVATLREAIESA